MERGVKLAMVVAAAVCIAAGLAWDRVISTVMDEPAAQNAADGGANTNAVDDQTSRMEFTFVGSLREPEPADITATDNPRATETISATPTPRSRAVADPLSPPSIKPAVPRERLHTVTSGERLGSISKKYFGTERYWHEIMEHNNIKDPKSLRPGQVLKIPDIQKD